MSQGIGTRVQLTAEQVSLFEQLDREEKAARRYRRHVSRARRLREQLKEIFGESNVAVFPAKKDSDRRAFLKTTEERDYEPLPEKTITVVKFHEIPIWDL